MSKDGHALFYAGAAVGILSSIVGNFGIASYFEYLHTGYQKWLLNAYLAFFVTAIFIGICLFGIFHFSKTKVWLNSSSKRARGSGLVVMSGLIGAYSSKFVEMYWNDLFSQIVAFLGILVIVYFIFGKLFDD